jgi:hypothetical protein
MADEPRQPSDGEAPCIPTFDAMHAIGKALGPLRGAARARVIFNIVLMQRPDALTDAQMFALIVDGLVVDDGDSAQRERVDQWLSARFGKGAGGG